MSSEPLEKIADVAASTLLLLAEQYRSPRNDSSSPRVAGIIALAAVEVQLLETAWQELLPLLDVEYASGAQLDVLARLAGIARGGLSDSDLRLTISAVLRSQYSGTADQVISAVKAYTSSNAVSYTPEYPASFWIVYDGSGMSSEYLQSLAPAGVLGLPGDFLVDASGSEIVTATDSGILVVRKDP